jgi:hypothetical protein
MSETILSGAVMTSRRTLPTSYDSFFARAFARGSDGVREPAVLFESAGAVDGLDECECGTPVINLTAFVEAIGEHYVLTDHQKERLEEELSSCGVEVSDEGTCREHTPMPQ